MALGGKYPVLLVGLVDTLTSVETKLLRSLSAMSYSSGMEIQKAANDATVAALKTKAGVIGEVSLISSLARLPIVLDGEIIPASMSNYSALMVKQLSIFEGATQTTQAANTVSIDIKTSRSAESAIFIDLLFSIADIIFSKSDIAPNVSFFGGSVAILNGYLVRLSRKGGSSAAEEIITLEIAKDLSFLFGGETVTTSPEKVTAVVEPAAGWQVGG